MHNIRTNILTRISSVLVASALTVTMSASAFGQLSQSGNGVVGRATGKLSDINLNGPGYMYYGVNGADRGLGYIGSYMTLGGFVPTLEDDFGGIWNADVRGHLSVNSGFFSNVGAVRKQLLNSGALLGLGIFWDYDGDLFQYPIYGADQPGAIFGPYGHVFQQVGVSGELLTDWGNLRTNGYIPVGSTGNQLVTTATSTGVFYQNYILPQNGLSAALGGADLELGAYVPALADWAGMINVGGYAFGNSRYTKIGGERHGGDLVPWFGGVYTRLDMTFANNWDFSLQYNNDSFFNSTGFARLTYRMGGSRRRNVPDQMEQPMFRNEHIVRANEAPIAALNPQNNSTPWHVIHVDNSAAPRGNGTAEAPYQTLADAQADAEATNSWNITYVHEGLATSTFNAYRDNFRFTADNQFLVGSGGPLTIGTQPINGSTLLTVGPLTAGKPVFTNPLFNSSFPGSSAGDVERDSSVLIAGDNGGVTIANIDIVGSTYGIAAAGDLNGTAQPVGTTANPTASSISNLGGSSVRNVSISGDGTNDRQTGVIVAGIRTTGTNTFTDEPTGGLEFTDTTIGLTTAQGLQVGLEQLLIPVPPSTDYIEAIANSGGDVNIDYSGSITNNINQNGNFSSLLMFIGGKAGGTVNVAASSTPFGATVANQVQDIGGEGIYITQNRNSAAGDATRINISNATLAESSNTAIYIADDQSTTNIRTAATSTYAYGIQKTGGAAAIILREGSPNFTFYGTAENAPPASGNNFLVDIRDTNGAVIDLSGPGLFPLNDLADGIQITNAAGGRISMRGVDLRGTGVTGIHVLNGTSADLDFRDITIQGQVNDPAIAIVSSGILLESSTSTASFSNISIEEDLAFHAVQLDTYTGDVTFIDLNARTSNNDATASTFYVHNGSPSSLTVGGTSILTNTATDNQVINLASGPTALNMNFATVSSENSNVAAPLAVELLGTGTFDITNSFEILGTAGTLNNISAPASITVTIP